MLTIRLQRTGTKNKSAFRIVLAEAHRSASKKTLEVLGHYNPRLKQFGVKNQDRLNQLLGQHVSVSPTVFNLLVEKKLVTGKKVKAWQPKKSASAEATSGSAEASREGGKEGAAPAVAGASLAPEGREAAPAAAQPAPTSEAVPVAETTAPEAPVEAQA